MTDLFDAQLTKLKAYHDELTKRFATACTALAIAKQEVGLLEAERNALVFAIETMEEVARGPAPTPAAPRAKRGSVEEAVMQELRAHGGRLSIEGIAIGTQAKASSVKSALTRLKKAGKVIDFDNGLYGLPPDGSRP